MQTIATGGPRGKAFSQYSANIGQRLAIIPFISGGGGGSRTRVPCAITRGIYMLSLLFVVIRRTREGALPLDQAPKNTACNLERGHQLCLLDVAAVP